MSYVNTFKQAEMVGLSSLVIRTDEEMEEVKNV